MKIHSLIFLLLLCAMSSTGQDAREILTKSRAKCQSVQNGYYEMTRYMKSMSRKDTTNTNFHCYFNKLKDDSIYSSAFHYKVFYDGVYGGDALYSGDDFVYTVSRDSTGQVMSKAKWATDMQDYKHNYKFYEPLTNRGSSPIPADSNIENGTRIARFIGEEQVGKIACYHIRVTDRPENDSAEPMKTLRAEKDFWINKSDFIPVQYTVAYDLVMNNDTMYQYERNVLDKYEINTLKDKTMLSLASIPAYYKIREYVPFTAPELLPKETIAPGWSIRSLSNKKVSLSDLKGQLVLIDFFYKSCYPCMQAIPTLQAIHEKYKDKGLRIVGIDPFDKPEDDIAAFLKKRGVTYTVLLGGNDAAKEYHVSGYPTIYLIGRDGKILFAEAGYGPGTGAQLEELIRKHL